VKPTQDERSPLAIAMDWSSRLTTIALEMALPALVGYWVDEKLGTKLVFLVSGAVLGLATGMWHLLKMTSKPRIAARPTAHPTEQPNDRPTNQTTNQPNDQQ
jgi:F0F1-type ATP synthase assembly protein I